MIIIQKGLLQQELIHLNQLVELLIVLEDLNLIFVLVVIVMELIIVDLFGAGGLDLRVYYLTNLNQLNPFVMFDVSQ